MLDLNVEGGNQVSLWSLQVAFFGKTPRHTLTKKLVKNPFLLVSTSNFQNRLSRPVVVDQLYFQAHLPLAC